MNASPFLSLFDNLPQRFDDADATAFLALFQAVGHRWVDANVLCLLLAEYRLPAGQHQPLPSYRRLAAASGGQFAYRVVSKSYDRLEQAQLINRSESGAIINLPAIRAVLQASAASNPQQAGASLWLMSVLQRWSLVQVLLYLVGEGAHERALRISRRAIAAALHLDVETIETAQRILTQAGLLQSNDSGHWSNWFVQADVLRQCLLQSAQQWQAKGGCDPWVRGIRYACSSGSIPGEQAISA